MQNTADSICLGARGVKSESEGNEPFFTSQLKAVRMAVSCLICLAVLPNVLAQIPPSITAPARSQTNWAGNNVILGAVVAGTEPFSYQWIFNGTPMAGQTNALLLLPMTTTNDTGSYSVVVTNISGSVTSSPTAVRITDQSVG